MIEVGCCRVSERIAFQSLFASLVNCKSTFFLPERSKASPAQRIITVLSIVLYSGIPLDGGLSSEPPFEEDGINAEASTQ